MSSGPRTDEVAVASVAHAIGGLLESVFAAVERTRRSVTALLDAVPEPTTGQLARLQPALRAELGGLVVGVGFVAAPGLLADVPAWLEWWQLRADARVQPLLLDLDPATSAYSDYTHWDWYALPRDTGQRAISGPYVDYLCTDEYSLTLAAPVHGPDGSFAGVAAADVYLRHFESVAVPALRALARPAFLVNPRGRVVASTTAARLPGDLARALDPAATHACGTIPLRLVTA
nr:cache domain-containing protein [Streptacidiphilus rugosus]